MSVSEGSSKCFFTSASARVVSLNCPSPLNASATTITTATVHLKGIEVEEEAEKEEEEEGAEEEGQCTKHVSKCCQAS